MGYRNLLRRLSGEDQPDTPEFGIDVSDQGMIDMQADMEPATVYPEGDPRAELPVREGGYLEETPVGDAMSASAFNAHEAKQRAVKERVLADRAKSMGTQVAESPSDGPGGPGRGNKIERLMLQGVMGGAGGQDAPPREPLRTKEQIVKEYVLAQRQQGPDTSAIDKAQAASDKFGAAAALSDHLSGAADLISGMKGPANNSGGLREMGRQKIATAEEKDRAVRDFYARKQAQDNADRGHAENVRQFDAKLAANERESAANREHDLAVKKRAGTGGLTPGVGKKEMGDLREAMAAHATLQRGIQKMAGAKAATGAEILPFWNADRSTQEAIQTELLLGLKEMAKTGTLDQQTERVAAGLIPSPGDSESTAKAKLAQFQDYIDTRLKAQKASLGIPSDPRGQRGAAPAESTQKQPVSVTPSKDGKMVRITYSDGSVEVKNAS